MKFEKGITTKIDSKNIVEKIARIELQISRNQILMTSTSRHVNDTIISVN